MAQIAVALFKFEGQRSDNLSFDEGDVISVLKQDDSGWWTGSDQDGRIGIFPYNYVQLEVKKDETKFRFAKALYDFHSDDPEDLSFNEGEFVTIIQELSPEWYLGRSEDGERTGQFPTSYVEVTDKEDTKAAEAEAKKFEKLAKKAEKEAQKALEERQEAERKLEKQRKIEREAAAKKEEAQRKIDETAAAKKAQRKAEERAAKLEAEAKAAKQAAEEAQRELKKAREMLESASRERSARVKSFRIVQDIQSVAAQTHEKFKGKDPGPAPPPSPQQQLTPISDEAEPPTPSRGGSFRDSLKRMSNRFSLRKSSTAKEEVPKSEPKEEAPVSDDRAAGTRREVNFKYRNKFAGLGGGSKCPKCNKGVGFADKVKALGNEWHKNCFRCDTCALILRQGNFSDSGGKPFCKICYGKKYGPKGFGFGGVTVPVYAEDRRPSKMGETDYSSPIDNLKLDNM